MCIAQSTRVYRITRFLVMATRSVHSDVWQYFEKGSGNVVCKVCGEKCAYHGGTSNLQA